MPSHYTTEECLRQGLSLLLHQWQATSSLWSDAAQYRFQKTYIDEYEPVVSSVLAELSQLDRVIEQAKRAVK